MNQFRIGSLYPVDQYGAPNIFLSSGYTLGTDENGYYVRDNGISNGTLKTTLEITTEPVEIKNISKFVSEWLIPQLTDKEDENSIFNQYLRTFTNTPANKGAWGAYSTNSILQALSYIGYRGYGFDQAANQTGEWAENPSDSGRLYQKSGTRIIFIQKNYGVRIMVLIRFCQILIVMPSKT